MVDDRVPGEDEERRSTEGRIKLHLTEPRLERSAGWAATATSILAVIAAVGTTVLTAVGLPGLIGDGGNSGQGVSLSFGDIPVGFWLGLGGVLVFGVLTVLLRESLTARRSAEAQEKAERALQGVEGPEDFLGFIRANASQMHAYDLMARRQAAQSHRASLVAMFVGLVLLASGVAVAVMAPDTVSKITGAFVTSVGAAVGGYVARTFMLNGRRSSENAAYYFQQPLVTSYLLTAERLIMKLPEADRPKALSMTIDSVLSQADIAARRPETIAEDNIQ